jgi:hypothetical protein
MKRIKFPLILVLLFGIFFAPGQAAHVDSTVLKPQSLPNSGCCEFDSRGFIIFIRSLYTRNVLSHPIQSVLFNEVLDEAAFTERIPIGDKTVFLKKTSSDNTPKLLRILFVSKVESKKIKIGFVYKESSEYRGTVTLGFNEEDKPLFLDAHFVTISQ